MITIKVYHGIHPIDYQEWNIIPSIKQIKELVNWDTITSITMEFNNDN
jgi:hypothetical protein